MGAMESVISSVAGDLDWLGVTAALKDQLVKLEQEIIEAETSSDYEEVEGLRSKLEGYRLALTVLVDAGILEI